MATKGILGTKLGMTQVFDDEGRIIPVTVVKAGPCPVVQVRSADRDRYTAVQLGFGERKAKSTNKPLAGHFAKAGVEPTRHLVEMEIEGSFELGQALTVDQFRMGDLVDVTGTSKGKGFAGGMKRHNFKGMGAGHGVHKTHRAPGSIGAASTPARVFKGTKMAGRMGNERVTVQMLEVVGVDNERNLLLIKGAIPGSNGGLVVIRDAVKAPVRAAAAGGDE